MDNDVVENQSVLSQIENTTEKFNLSTKIQVFFKKNKEFISAGFLLAFISAVAGISFSLGRQFAGEDQIKLYNVEKSLEDMTTVMEFMSYTTYNNNIEAVEKIDELISNNPSDELKFIALENKARIFIRQKGNKEVYEIGDKMVKDFNMRYNGYHWRGLAHFRMTVKNYGKNNGTRPLNKSKLEESLDDFTKSISIFSNQIKDRINEVEVLIALERYDDAINKIDDVKLYSHLKEDFHVLILDYLSIICKILNNDCDETELIEIIDRIIEAKKLNSVNYTSNELEIVIQYLELEVNQRNKINKILNVMKEVSDPNI